MKNKTLLLTIPASILLFGMTFAYGGTSHQKSTSTSTQEVFSASEEVRATVKAIDYKTREVTLRETDGEEFSFIAGSDVKNLNQIKKGDVVIAEYSEALVYDIDHSGKTQAMSETIQAETARPGSTPGATAEREVTASVVINKIDKKVPSVTFKDADGKLSTFKVRHPERLEGVKVGDVVNITYKQAVAMRVEKANKM